VRRSLHQIAAAVALSLLLAATAHAAGRYHTVRPGESLASIARSYRVPLSEVAKANRLTTAASPAPGTRLWVPIPTPVRTTTAPARRSPEPAYSARRPEQAAPRSSSGTIVVQSGDSLWTLSKRHGVTIRDLARANGLGTNSGLKIGQTLRLPGAEAALPAARPEPARTSTATAWTPPGTIADSEPVAPPPSPKPRDIGTPGAVSSRGYAWPVDGRLSRGYKSSSTEKHAGIDIEVPFGTKVRAAADGRVVYAGNSITAYGHMVIIEHSGGVATCYAHNSRLNVSVDQRVTRGQMIALSGQPHNSDRPMVHFQLRRSGEAVDPMPYLP